MNFILNILIILFLIIALILILLCIPATLYIEKNQGEKLKLKVSYLFIKQDISKFNKNNKTNKNPEKPKEKKDDKEIPFTKKITHYCHIISEGLKEVNYILSKTKVKNLYLKILFAEGDAAFRAISFGVISSAVYPILGVIENKTKVAKGAFDLDIKCDYNANKSEYAFNVTIKLSLIFALIGGLRFYGKLRNLKFPSNSK